MTLENISVGVKTFLRDEKLFKAIEGIRKTMPEVTIIVADCGEDTIEKTQLYVDLTRSHHRVLILPFDSGFGAMSNAIIDDFDTDYLLIGSDDFDFEPPSVRKGIEKMLDVLENSDVDIACGRVRGPYEFNLEDLGSTVIEHPVHMSQLDKDSWYVEIDLGINYYLAKRHVYDRVRWEDSTKIGGGEHGAQFLKHKRQGHKVAWIPGVQISEQEGPDSPRYVEYRNRAKSKARPAFDAIGVKKYVLGSGQIDYQV